MDHPEMSNDEMNHHEHGVLMGAGPPVGRRGVSSVLAMMFLVVFGSLSIAMAIMAQGNLRAADSALRVSRAASAAQTGLVFGSRRLAEEARRWVVRRGTIDAGFGSELWSGQVQLDGEEVRLLDSEYYQADSAPSGLMEGIMDAHLADAHSFVAQPGDGLLPEMHDGSRLETRPIRIIADDPKLSFRVGYELVTAREDETRVRITSTGEDDGITRSISMEYLVTKRIPFAVVSPNRIMIGKNVMVEGPLGTRFGMEPGELNQGNGDPLVMKSDFGYLDDELDLLLEEFEEAISEFDVDGDGRIRPNHPVESVALDGTGFRDADGDQYVTGFDLFLEVFDDDSDGRVVWDSGRAAQAGIESSGEEFRDIDNQLARLIDTGFADRNLDGTVDEVDVRLGYDDGVLDAYDMYAKVRGSLSFGVAESDWNAANGGPWRRVVGGSVVSDAEVAAITFEAPEERLREVTTEMFADSQAWYRSRSGGQGDLVEQVQANLAGSGSAEFTSFEEAEWEAIPVGSPNPYDWMRRDVYRGMVFRDLLIPPGSNPRFEDCTFVGTTYVQTTTECSHPNWNYLGALDRMEDADGNTTFEPKFSGLEPAPGPDGSGDILDTKEWSNNIVFEGCTFVGVLAGDRPAEYTHWRNKLQFTGPTRFYLDPESTDLGQQPDVEEITGYIEAFTPEELDYFSRSTMMMPGWSVDVGNFDNQQSEEWESTPVVNLRGVVVAGVLDARGTVDVHGTLLMTFRPRESAGPLFYGGSPDQFNTTLGYFGPEEGDLEGGDPSSGEFEGFGEIRLRYDPESRLPDGIPWPIVVEPLPGTYTEGAYR